MKLSNFKLKYVTEYPGGIDLFGTHHATVDVTVKKRFKEPETYTMDIMHETLGSWVFKATMQNVPVEIYKLYDNLPSYREWSNTLKKRNREYEQWLRR